MFLPSAFRFSVSSLIGLVSLSALIGLRYRDSQVTALRMACTTTVRDSGLLNSLLPPLQQGVGETHCLVTASGSALALLKSGDIDLAIVHSPEQVAAAVRDGVASRAEEVMSNQFVIVGPISDPAAISGCTSVEAFQAIQNSHARFVSRSDQSGTHQMEQSLWNEARRRTDFRTIDAGSGMSRTLRIADELSAYTLVDRGTWLQLKSQLRLVVLVNDPNRLQNRYHVVVANSADQQRIRLANSAADWLISDQGQSTISDFVINGAPAFVAKQTKETQP